MNAQSSKRNSEQPSACMRASAYACVHACVRICVYMHTRICVFMRWHTVHAFQRGHDRIHRNCRMPLGSAEHRRKPLRRVKKAEASRANHTCRSPHELVVHRGTCDDADQRTSSDRLSACAHGLVQLTRTGIKARRVAVVGERCRWSMPRSSCRGCDSLSVKRQKRKHMTTPPMDLV